MGFWEDLRTGKELAKITAATSPKNKPVENSAYFEKKMGELLEQDEKILMTLVGKHNHTLVLTDRKAVYLSGTTEYHLVYPYESIKNVTWTDKGYGTSFMEVKTTLGTKDLYGIPKDDAVKAIKLMKQMVGTEKKDDEVAAAAVAGQSKFDFKLLKDGFARGGLGVYTILCPECCASLTLPDNGDAVKCMKCGKNITAFNIYERLRALFRTP